MNCTIPSLNIKVLARALQSLSKIGEELFIEINPQKLSLFTFNQCKTVCCQFHMLDCFFSIYQPKETTCVQCKIHLKTLLPLFKGTNLEKKLEHLQIIYNNPNDTIKFKMKFKVDDIVLCHTLRLMDPELLSMDSYQAGTNTICSDAHFFSSLLTMFATTDNDVTMDVQTTQLVVRNYCIGTPHKPKSARIQISLKPSEFHLYKIQHETVINFMFRPLRTAIAFAEALNVNLDLSFNCGGEPLLLCAKNSTFELRFIVATMNPIMPISQNSNRVMDQSSTNSNKRESSKSDDSESPRSKKVRIVFAPSFEKTFNEDEMMEMMLRVLVPDSDED